MNEYIIIPAYVHSCTSTTHKECIKYSLYTKILLLAQRGSLINRYVHMYEVHYNIRNMYTCTINSLALTLTRTTKLQHVIACTPDISKKEIGMLFTKIYELD